MGCILSRLTALSPKGPVCNFFNEEEEELIFYNGIAILVLLPRVEYLKLLLLRLVRSQRVLWPSVLNHREYILYVYA